MDTTSILIRRAEPKDAEAIARVYESPRVIWGTLQLPFPSVERWRERLQPNEEHYLLVATVENEIVGTLGLHTNPFRPRRRHVASLGMGVRDD